MQEPNNIVPIVLTFDNNMVFPASVCISSLAMSAAKGTFYDVIVLYAGEKPIVVGQESLLKAFSNIRITYRPVGDAFDDCYEVRGITKATYYRLLATELIPEYDRVIYADVDIIFRRDLSAVYCLDIDEKYAAAVVAPSISGSEYAKDLGVSGDYYNAGFLLMNLKKMREDGMTDVFSSLAKRNFKYQDQDVLNIACKGKIYRLPASYSHSVKSSQESVFNDGSRFPIGSESNSNIHYNGQKPWKGLCPNFDIWWECYRKSPIFNPKYYFAFFYNQLEPLEQLSLSKRIKVLLRYFVYGCKQSKIKVDYL